MKVKVLSRHIVRDPRAFKKKKSESGTHMTPYEELYQLSEQFIIWFRTAPYRAGLDERLRGFHSVLHQVVKSEHVLVPVPVPHQKPDVYILELDMLDDGKLYDAYDIYYEDGVLYAEVDVMKEMSLEEYDSRAEINRKRLNKLMQKVQQNNKEV